MNTINRQCWTYSHGNVTLEELTIQDELVQRNRKSGETHPITEDVVTCVRLLWEGQHRVHYIEVIDSCVTRNFNSVFIVTSDQGNKAIPNERNIRNRLIIVRLFALTKCKSKANHTIPMQTNLTPEGQAEQRWRQDRRIPPAAQHPGPKYLSWGEGPTQVFSISLPTALQPMWSADGSCSKEKELD